MESAGKEKKKAEGEGEGGERGGSPPPSPTPSSARSQRGAAFRGVRRERGLPVAYFVMLITATCMLQPGSGVWGDVPGGCVPCCLIGCLDALGGGLGVGRFRKGGCIFPYIHVSIRF